MKICVLGGGSWGIALSVHLHRAGHQVSLWEYDPARAETLTAKRESKDFLPGILLPQGISISHQAGISLQGAEGVVLVVPSHVIRSTARTAAPHWPQGAFCVCAAKGLEEGTHLRMSQVMEASLPAGTPLGVISGPSHAEEVSRQMPTTVVAASKTPGLPEKLQETFHSDAFRVYTSSDMIGVELGGSLKNVIAIAAGITDGLGLGDNAKAALMTRGLHEMTRLGVALGAQPRTFAGLAGMGDLIVTCTSRHSRNRQLGEMIGQGATLQEALAKMVMVAEGVKTSRAALEMAQGAGVDVPIIAEVERVLFGGKSAKEAVRSLLSRSAKPEQDLV